MSRRSLEEPVYAHFAMVYIDSSGNLCQRTSDSISESLQSILSPGVTVPLGVLLPSNRQPLKNSPALSQGQSVSYSGMGLGSPQRVQVPFPSQPEPPFQPAMSLSRESWLLQASSQPKMNSSCRNLKLAARQKAYISRMFQTLQQTNCRIIAKAYIKLLEPRKQVNYPYNGRKTIEGRTQQLDPEATKPSGAGPSSKKRIRLLVHMLCDMRETHGVTAAGLKQCDQSIRRQILPVERLETLDEVYRVREEEEKFLDGNSGTYLSTLCSTSPQTHVHNLDGEYVSIACINLPQIAEGTPSGQGSPTEPVSSQNIIETKCSEGISDIDITQVTPRDLLSAPSYNTSTPYNPAMNFDPKTQYHSAGLCTNISTSLLELSKKQESLSARAHLIDWALPIGITPNLPRGALVPTYTSTENELTETVMPYGHAYYFNY
ncbi:unnamed protein product [Penicillium nalgiovense]|nr:unnamed protein product [Penicillium nalgiovense]